MNIQFFERDFGRRVKPAGVSWRINAMQYDAVGGCSKATLTATGKTVELWELVEYLRRPVVIYDGRCQPVWWGYVHATAVREGQVEIRQTMDTMSNRVAVAYSRIEVGTNTVGERMTTAWAEDAASVAAFGYKEWLSSTDGTTDAQALARRDAILAALRWPQGEMAVEEGMFGKARSRARYSGAEHSQSASLELRGWWGTLGWRYADMPPVNGLDYSYWSGAGAINIGQSSYLAVAQMFTAPKSGTVREVTLSVGKQGTVTDNLVVKIFATTSPVGPVPTGDPLGEGVVLGSSLNATASPGSGDLVTVTLTDGVEITQGVIYGLVVERSAAADLANYYVVNLDEGHIIKDCRIWITYPHVVVSGWWDLSYVPKTNANMPYILWMDNEVGVARQIDDLVELYGQFMVDASFEDVTTRTIPSFLEGDTTALEEVETLMTMGGANDRRLLAMVDWGRRVRFYEEPARPVSGSGFAYYLRTDGSVVDGHGMAIRDKIWQVAGNWCKLQGVVPGSVDMSTLIDPSVQFIEGVRVTGDGKLRLSFRAQPSIEDMLEVE